MANLFHYGKGNKHILLANMFREFEDLYEKNAESKTNKQEIDNTQKLSKGQNSKPNP